MQAQCYLGDVAETRVRTAMPQQLLCGVRAAGWQKVRLKFLYVAAFPWPTCSHADASPAVFPRQVKACYRRGRAHPWPGRIRTCWTTHKVSWTDFRQHSKKMDIWSVH